MSLYSSVCQSTIRIVYEYVGGPGGHDTNCTDFLCRRGVRMPPAFFVENVVAGTHGIKTTHWHRPHGTDPEANGMEQARKQADGGLGSMYAPAKAKYVLVADLRAALKLHGQGRGGGEGGACTIRSACPLGYRVGRR